MSFDVIVCGAGPGGAAAATRLAAGGARVLILERHSLPRDKACGGGMTRRALDLAGGIADRLIEAKVETTRWGFRHGPDRVDLPTGTIGMVRRRDFDLALVEQAVGSGTVTVNDSVAVTSVLEDADGVTVQARTGERWRAPFVVGADGAAGVTATAIGLGRRTLPGIALDVDIEVAPEIFAEHARTATFELSVLPDGYGWIFPKNGYLSCGVGTGISSVRLPPALDAYLARVFPAGSILSQRRRGHRLPLYEGPGRIATRRVVLVGDAASLVDPIMGEGILYALMSGGIAADVILGQLGGAILPDEGQEYGDRVHRAIGVELDRLRRYIGPIYERSPELFFRRFFLEKGDYTVLARTLGERLEGATLPVSTARMIQS